MSNNKRKRGNKASPLNSGGVFSEVAGVLGGGSNPSKGDTGSSSSSSSGVGYSGSKSDASVVKKAINRAKAQKVKSDTDLRARLEAFVQALRSTEVAEQQALLERESTTTLVEDLRSLFRDTSSWDARRSVFVTALGVVEACSRSTVMDVLLGNCRTPNSLVSILETCKDEALVMIRLDKGNGKGTLAERFLSAFAEAEAAADRTMREGRFWDMDERESDDGFELAEVMRDPFREKHYVTVEEESDAYKQALGAKDIRIRFVEHMKDHAFRKAPGGVSNVKSYRTLMKELSSYINALPVEHGSSIFVRACESRVDLIRVLIIGPEKTPYSNGCFFFDIYCPPTYPNVSPKVQFLTTGKGSVRFNPNLYANGKVCLSLLGTWAGPGWVPGHSTLLQVLISIQSLIFVPDPYFNEPGYAAMQHTEQGKSQAKKYDANIRKQSMEWAIHDVLEKSPYPEFDDVVRAHFFHKRSTIVAQLIRWARLDLSEPSTPTSSSDWRASGWIAGARPLYTPRSHSVARIMDKLQKLYGSFIVENPQQQHHHQQQHEVKFSSPSTSSSSSSASTGVGKVISLVDIDDEAPTKPKRGTCNSAAPDAVIDLTL